MFLGFIESPSFCLRQIGLTRQVSCVVAHLSSSKIVSQWRLFRAGLPRSIIRGRRLSQVSTSSLKACATGSLGKVCTAIQASFRYLFTPASTSSAFNATRGRTSHCRRRSQSSLVSVVALPSCFPVACILSAAVFLSWDSISPYRHDGNFCVSHYLCCIGLPRTNVLPHSNFRLDAAEGCLSLLRKHCRRLWNKEFLHATQGLGFAVGKVDTLLVILQLLKAPGCIV